MFWEAGWGSGPARPPLKRLQSVTVHYFRALRRFTQLSWRERALLVEAAILLSFASLAVAILPFRRVTRLAGKTMRERASPDSDARIALVRWAVSACGRFAPWKPVCFQHGLAAHWMLRRRHLPSTLYYGAASDIERGIVAHVWVKSGETAVIGCEEADRYATLAVFPSR